MNRILFIHLSAKLCVSNMSSLSKKIGPLFSIVLLLSVAIVRSTASQQQENLPISSFGIIRYPGVIYVDFENASHFEWGQNASIWTLDYVAVDPPDNLFEPTSKIVHGGGTSANISLNNPIEDHRRRIHVERIMDPINDMHIWLEVWYYLPEGFQVDDWTNLHRPIEERWWGKDGGYEYFQITISLNIDSRTSQPTYNKLVLHTDMSRGEVDNDRDSINDFVPKGPIDVYSPSVVPLGQWFKITTYVYRDMDHGIYTMWLDEVLQWNLTEQRTIGILPERIAAGSPYPSGKTLDYTWLATGFGLYAGDLPNVHPKWALYDDIVISAYPTKKW